MESTNSKLQSNLHDPLTATSLQRLLFYVAVDGAYIPCNFNSLTSATSSQRQRQRPLKCVRPVKKIFRQKPARQRLTNACCIQYPFFHCKKSQNLIRIPRRWSLFLFGFYFFNLFSTCYVFACYNNKYCFENKNKYPCQKTNKQTNSYLSIKATSCVKVRLIKRQQTGPICRHRIERLVYERYERWKIAQPSLRIHKNMLDLAWLNRSFQFWILK